MTATHTEKTAATDRIQIIFPPAMERFIAELHKACGMSLEEYRQSYIDLLEKEVADTFSDLPCPGMLDHIAMTEGEEVTRAPIVRKIIERHQGKFSLAGH